MTNEELLLLRGALVIRTNVQRYPKGYGSPDYTGPTINPAWRYTLDERPLERRGLTRAQFDQMLAERGLDPVTVPADKGDVLRDAEYEALNAPSRAAVDAEADRRINAGFIFNGVHFQSDLKAQKRIAGAATLAGQALSIGAKAPTDTKWHNAGGPADPEFRWIATDNSFVVMDALTVVQFGQEAAAWESRHVFAAAAIKALDPIPQDYTDDAYWPA